MKADIGERTNYFIFHSIMERWKKYEIPDELYERYNRIMKEYDEIQVILEKIYYDGESE